MHRLLTRRPLPTPARLAALLTGMFALLGLFILGPAALAIAATAESVGSTSAAQSQSAAGSSIAADSRSALSNTGLLAAAKGSVDDFEFLSWTSEWNVGLETTPGGKDRSYAEVTETIVPVFPDHNQNRGIIRTVPLAIGDDRMDVSSVKVRDENGDAVEFEDEVSGGDLIIEIGDDSYVHGEQTYVLTYKLHDVIADLGNPEVQELYANLLPTTRLQPIETFSAQVTLAPELAEAVVGDASCYRGEVGSTESCEIRADGLTYSVEPGAMPPGETLTIDIGFTPGTVPELSLLDRVGWFPFAAAALPPLGLLATVVLFIVQWRRSRHAPGGVVVAQYQPRPDLPPQLAGQVLTSMAPQAFPASILDAAIRGAIRIEESADADSPADAGGSVSASHDKLRAPVLRKLTDATGLHPVERRFVDEVLFAEHGTVDTAESAGAATVALDGNESIAEAYPAFSKDPQNSATTAGFLEKSAAASQSKNRTLWVSSVSIFVTFVVFIYTVIANAGVLIGITAAVLGALVVFVFSSAVRPTRLRTSAGAEARDHLLGLREYIKLSEADRIQALQSVQTAERTDARGAGPAASTGSQIIEVYEQLLPYAVMFGLDKTWAKELQLHYESSGTTPYWLAGYQPATFAAAMSTVKHSAHTSMPAAPSGGGASTSGFAGGGFAGGGVGGGSVGGR